MLRLWYRDDDGREAYRDKEADKWEVAAERNELRLYLRGRLVANINNVVNGEQVRVEVTE